MHDKSFTVSGHAAILGGGNVGDEDFATGPTALHVNLDVLAVGAAVPELRADFDRCWAAPAVHPAGPIVGPPREGVPVAARLASLRGDPRWDECRAVLDGSGVASDLAAGDLDLE